MLYKIADLIIQMNPQYEPLKSQSIPYLSSEHFHVDISIPDLTTYVEKYHHENTHLSIGECEYIIYGSYFYTKLIEFDAILLHASAVIYKDKAYLFSAPSGTGKSTHTSLWVKYLNAFILNDDKPAIRFINNEFWVYGTPFTGKTDTGVNAKYKLGNIVFIQRATDKNKMIDLNSKDSLKNFLRETVRPYEEDKMDKVLLLYEKLKATHPFKQVNVDISKDAVYTSLHGLGLISGLEYTLETKGFVVTNIKGSSMLPLLKESIDQVMIEQNKDIYLYDVVLFRSKDKLVIHRIIKQKKDYYYITGDNQYKLEKVHKNQILGVATNFIKDGITIDRTNKEYQKYVHQIVKTRFIRAVKRKVKKIFTRKEL